MADLVPTAANVHIHGSNAVTARVQFGETITAGECVYKKTSDGKYWKTDCTAAATSVFAGIAVNGNATDKYGLICTSGDVDVGAAVVIGTPYVLSITGDISPAADITSGDTVTHLGYAVATDALRLAPVSSIVTLA